MSQPFSVATIGRIVAIALAVAPLWSGAHAQDPAPKPAESAPSAPTDPLGRYRATEVEMRPAFGNLEPFELRQRGRSVDVGLFGGDAAALFGASPEAMAAMARYRTRKQIGFGLWATGLAVLVGALVLTAVESDIVVETNGEFVTAVTPAWWGLLLGGTALGAAGGIVMQSAMTPLGEAVDAWNEHAAQKASALGGQQTLKLGGTF
jgi:hypothetical protein